MEIKIISFTKKGYILSKRIYHTMKATDNIEIFAYPKFIDENDLITKKTQDFKTWTKNNFNTNVALIFISALGIAVRAISTHINDKFTDPAILCIDEMGKFVIPILSGHIGGANELAKRISSNIKALSIITTATDLNDKWAVDIFAKKNNLFIEDRKLAKSISSRILDGEKIFIKSDFRIEGKLPKNIYITDEIRDIYITYKNIKKSDTLLLAPKCLCLGIGCRKNVDAKLLFNSFNKFVIDNHINIKSIKYISSIDLKKDEEAIKKLANILECKLLFFDPISLNNIDGEFKASDFVKKITGVDNVCERAAMKVFSERIVKKTKLDKVTMALSLDNNIKIDFNL